jgi:hypothetical protein
VFVPVEAVGAAGVPVKVGLAIVAKPALGNVTAALPDPSSGEIVIEPLALFNLIDIVVFLSYNTSPLAYIRTSRRLVFGIVRVTPSLITRFAPVIISAFEANVSDAEIVLLEYHPRFFCAVLLSATSDKLFDRSNALAPARTPASQADPL